MRFIVILFSLLLISRFALCQSDLHVPIEPIPTSTITSSKPQSKVWKYKEDFYSVFPNSSGTYMWKLVGQQWIQHLQLSKKTNSKADCYTVSDTVFILLYQGQYSEFTAVKMEEHQYQFLNPTDSISQIVFDASAETATIAFDTNATLWLTYEAENRIEVRSSESPYTNWSNPVTISDGVANDDISGIVTMSSSIGVLWSNQNTERFGFKIHDDGDPISDWSSDEMPASQSALDLGKGMADDHINLKYTADGELYAAIKTSYDTFSISKIGLLVRRSSGTWDNLHHVSYAGTRPIVTIDNSNNLIRVYYTSKESGGEIVFKESPLKEINFGEEHVFLDGGKYNNAASTKFPYDCENLIIASDDSSVFGNVIDCR